ncbi:DUF2726 domain-containing protein [Micromonospora ureilytica]|uniref:DUF2726 domain-containing protein n=1 Tax=Micromonospora ureilytica TaxID=709868 RepID=A0ABS0JH31_9ACTN|nr:DUF2726 domain-containing protein [Micromonospora ureilytica]MBG6065786.1 hypothetical protein [Micromonospora ureilytica]WSR54602.1 DUF2726 domain-containing protein [Micromonospora ureilytica]
MTSIGSDDRGWLRTMPAEAGRDALPSRAGHRVLSARRLSDLVQGRPPGVTGSQWTSASRASFDFVVYAADTGRPIVAVEIGAVPSAGSAEQRVERLKDAVSAAAGLPVLRIGSPTLRAADHGRRLVEYVIDARAYAAGGAGSTAAGPEPAPVGFRDILGRLPDGRTGPVNDLGALTRAAAVEAYVAGQVADPIVRGLHVRWVDGPAQGWSWVQVRPDACLIERVSVTEHRFSCGIDAARLAEDLAAVAVGDRLRENAVADLLPRAEWTAQIVALSQRRHELVGGFAFDHLCAD